MPPAPANDGPQTCHLEARSFHANKTGGGHLLLYRFLENETTYTTLLNGYILHLSLPFYAVGRFAKGVGCYAFKLTMSLFRQR